MSVLPYCVKAVQHRTDPVRHGAWSQSVAQLQAMQCRCVRTGDLYKLAQSVLLQAYGGFGLEALHTCVTHVFLGCIGPLAPEVGEALIMCYARWSHTLLTAENFQAFLKDLYLTCQTITMAPKQPVGYVPDTTPLTDLEARQVVQWQVQYEHHPVMSACGVCYELLHSAADLPWRRPLWEVMQHVASEQYHPRARPPVFEAVDMQALWCQLFPLSLALPVLSTVEETDMLEKLQQCKLVS